MPIRARDVCCCFPRASVPLEREEPRISRAGVRRLFTEIHSLHGRDTFRGMRRACGRLPHRSFGRCRTRGDGARARPVIGRIQQRAMTPSRGPTPLQQSARTTGLNAAPFQNRSHTSREWASTSVSAQRRPQGKRVRKVHLRLVPRRRLETQQGFGPGRGRHRPKRSQESGLSAS